MCGFTMGSSYWLKCVMSKKDAESLSDMKAEGGISAILGSAKGGYSKKESLNISSIVSNTVRHMSGHTLDH